MLIFVTIIILILSFSNHPVYFHYIVYTFDVLLYLYFWIAFTNIWICVYMHIQRQTYMPRLACGGQETTLWIQFSPSAFKVFWGLNSDGQVWTANTFTCSSILLALAFVFVIDSTPCLLTKLSWIYYVCACLTFPTAPR